MSKRLYECSWRVSRPTAVVKNASDSKVSRINEHMTEIPSDIKESTVVLFLNKNPFKSLKGLATLQNLRELYLDSTNLTSLKYANDQPSLEIISFFNTPFYEQSQAKIMCGLAFQKLKEVNKIRFTEKEKEFCELHGKELRIELYDGLILKSVNPIRWVDPVTKKKIEFYAKPNKPIKRRYLEINQKYPPKKKVTNQSQSNYKNKVSNSDHKKQELISKLSKSNIHVDDAQNNDDANSIIIEEEEEVEEEESKQIDVSKFAQFSSDDDANDNFDFPPNTNPMNVSNINDVDDTNSTPNTNTAAAAVNSLATRFGMNFGNDSDSDSDMQTDFFNKMGAHNKDFIKSLQTSSAYSSTAPETDKSRGSRRRHKKGTSSAYSSNAPERKEKNDADQQETPKQQYKMKPDKINDDSFAGESTDYNTSLHPQKVEQKKQIQQPQQQQQQKQAAPKDDEYYDYTEYSSAKPGKPTAQPQQQQQQQPPPQKQAAPKDDEYYDYTEYSSAKPGKPTAQPQPQQQQQQQQQKQAAPKDDEYYDYTEYSSVKPGKPTAQPQQQPQQQKQAASKDDEYYDYAEYSDAKPGKQPAQQQKQPQQQQQQQQQAAPKDDEYYDYAEYSDAKPGKPPAQQQKPAAPKDEEYSEYEYTDYTSTKPGQKPQNQPAQQQQKQPVPKDEEYSEYEYTDYTSTKPGQQKPPIQQQQKQPVPKDEEYSEYDYTDYVSAAQK